MKNGLVVEIINNSSSLQGPCSRHHRISQAYPAATILSCIFGLWIATVFACKLNSLFRIQKQSTGRCSSPFEPRNTTLPRPAVRLSVTAKQISLLADCRILRVGFLRTPFISEMISIYAFFNRPVVFYFRGMSFMFVVCTRYIRREMESASPNSLRYGSLGAQLGTLTAVTQLHKTCVAVLWR